MIQEYLKGDLIYVELPSVGGSIQSGKRPCIVVSNNVCNRYSPVITIVPLTSRKKHEIPTHVHLKSKDVFDMQNANIKDSTILCEQIITIPKDSIVPGCAKIKPHVLKSINEALAVQLNL